MAKEPVFLSSDREKNNDNESAIDVVEDEEEGILGGKEAEAGKEASWQR